MLNKTSPYSDADPVIEKWVKALGSTLSTEWADQPARFFYVAGDPPFECFLISVAPPAHGRIKVDAHAVDTNDDTEDDLEASWTGDVGDLDAMLASAIDTISAWKKRQRTKPDPPSPW